jgi:adenylyl- and sulfurtransferase ThiI
MTKIEGAEMNRDDIIRMAREAGLSKIIYNEQNGCATLQTMFHPENIEHFAALVAAAEREECAKTAEAVVPRHTECGNKIAFAIRERGAP